MKIFLDGRLPAPAGWESAATAADAIDVMEQCAARGEDVESLSISDDLGGGPPGGRVLDWLEECACRDGNFAIPAFMDVHSASGPARMRMEAAIGRLQAMRLRRKLYLWLPDDFAIDDAGIALSLPMGGARIAEMLDRFCEAEDWMRERRAMIDAAPPLLAGGLRRIEAVWPNVFHMRASAQEWHLRRKEAHRLALSGAEFQPSAPCVLTEGELYPLLGVRPETFGFESRGVLRFCAQTQSDAMFNAGLMLTCPSRGAPAPQVATVYVPLDEVKELLRPFAMPPEEGGAPDAGMEPAAG